MTPTIKIEGLREMGQKLEKLAESVRTEIAANVLAELADDIVVTAKAKVLVDTGALRESIDSWVKQEGSLSLAFAGTNAMMLRTAERESLYKGDTFYGGFIEFGFHRGKRVGGKRRGTKLIIENDSREQVPAQPFLRPAFDAHYPKWLEALPSRIQEELDRVTNAA